MASADFDTFGNPPYLNSNEQNLLLNALKSNNDASTASADASLNPDLTQLNADSGFFDPAMLDNDLTNDFTWDLDAELEGLREDDAGPSSHSADGDDASPDSQSDGKRKEHPDDDEDDDESPGGKRRESEGKIAKKPGRKPLTSEPTSKRKAQNRAAQRAFRERKEKHLRDLETKVEDLEKASESTNHENGILRAQVDRLNAELTEYKKRMASTVSPAGYSPSSNVNKINWDINNNFNFEFPTSFGLNPASTDQATAAKATKASKPLSALKELQALEKSSAEQNFYHAKSHPSFSSLSSPSPLSSARSMSMSTSNGGSTIFNANKPARSPTNRTDKSGSISASPASLGLASSCATTPDATADSPQNRSNEVASPGQPKTPGQDTVPGMDWFSNQGNGLFDPILFGDYREPQDNILGNADLNLDNFDSAFPWNLDSTMSAPWPTTSALDPALPPKKTLMEQVEKAAHGKEFDEALNRHGLSSSKTNQLTCAKLWDRVQRSEKVLSGEADMDDLCSQLKAKAKCGGPNKGAVVDERDVDAILGPDPAVKKTGMQSMFS